MSSLTFTAGILLCRSIRKELDIAKFRGDIEDYYESSGWLDRTFVVKGESDAIRRVCERVDKWMN